MVFRLSGWMPVMPITTTAAAAAAEELLKRFDAAGKRDVFLLCKNSRSKLHDVVKCDDAIVHSNCDNANNGKSSGQFGIRKKPLKT